MNLPNAALKCIPSLVIAHLPAVCQPPSLLCHDERVSSFKLALCVLFAHKTFPDSAALHDASFLLLKKKLQSDNCLMQS